MKDPAWIRIGFVQFTPVLGERLESRTDENLAAVDHLLECTRPDADLIVLPEFFTTGYFFRSSAEPASLAETAGDGPTTEALRGWARRYGGTWVGGFVERGPGRDGRIHLWNSALVVPPEGETGLYRKTHLFYEEKRWFEPGDTGFRTFEIATRAGPVRIGVIVCYDWRFPEATRALALAGAEVIAQPANLVHPHCQDAMRTRALENRVYTITANRGGVESNGAESLEFTGQSQIAGPNGNILVRAPDAIDRVEVVSVDIQHARAKDVTSRNDILSDRRPDLYGSVTDTDPRK